MARREFLLLPGWTRFKRLCRRLCTAWWSWRFGRHCEQVGANLQVQGPCIVRAEGSLRVGTLIFVRSFAHNRVELSISAEGRLSIGDRVFLNQGVRIACSREIIIGNGCQIGDECVILDNDFHGAGGGTAKSALVVLGDNVWLATRVIVLRGVTIGEGSVVGAGSVETRSVPPNSLVARSRLASSRPWYR